MASIYRFSPIIGHLIFPFEFLSTPATAGIIISVKCFFEEEQATTVYSPMVKKTIAILKFYLLSSCFLFLYI